MTSWLARTTTEPLWVEIFYVSEPDTPPLDPKQ